MRAGQRFGRSRQAPEFHGDLFVLLNFIFIYRYPVSLSPPPWFALRRAVKRYPRPWPSSRPLGTTQDPTKLWFLGFYAVSSSCRRHTGFWTESIGKSHPPSPLRKHAESQENNGQTGPCAQTRQCIRGNLKGQSEKQQSDGSACLDKTVLAPGGGGVVTAHLAQCAYITAPAGLGELFGGNGCTCKPVGSRSTPPGSCSG